MILDNLSAQVEPSRLVAVMGPTGCGEFGLRVYPLDINSLYVNIVDWWHRKNISYQCFGWQTGSWRTSRWRNLSEWKGSRARISIHICICDAG